MVWNLFPFKSDFSLGKIRKSQGAQSELSGAESPGWFDVSPKTAWDVMHEWVHSWHEAANHRLAVHSRGLFNRWNSFHGRMFKLNTIFDANLLLYLLSYFECNGHTVYRLNQRHLPTSLTSTVKSSLFMHSHSSPLSLAAKLHPCCTNHSCYINNGWTFSGQTSY